ncbi:hypothetical protein [Aliamphritea spongicola]|nr:hypothetical protein [Aliamphritea spongicola]
MDSPAKAFSLYLGAGKPGDIKVDWPDMAAAISCLHQAGGYAVLAHPTKYKLTFTKIREMIAAFAESGGDGVEARYPGLIRGRHAKLKLLHSGMIYYCRRAAIFIAPVLVGVSWENILKCQIVKCIFFISFSEIGCS